MCIEDYKHIINDVYNLKLCFKSKQCTVMEFVEHKQETLIVLNDFNMTPICDSVRRWGNVETTISIIPTFTIKS